MRFHALGATLRCRRTLCRRATAAPVAAQARRSSSATATAVWHCHRCPVHLKQPRRRPLPAKTVRNRGEVEVPMNGMARHDIWIWYICGQEPPPACFGGSIPHLFCLRRPPAPHRRNFFVSNRARVAGCWQLTPGRQAQRRPMSERTAEMCLRARSLFPCLDITTSPGRRHLPGSAIQGALIEGRQDTF